MVGATDLSPGSRLPLPKGGKRPAADGDLGIASAGETFAAEEARISSAASKRGITFLHGQRFPQGLAAIERNRSEQVPLRQRVHRTALLKPVRRAKSANETNGPAARAP